MLMDRYDCCSLPVGRDVMHMGYRYDFADLSARVG